MINLILFDACSVEKPICHFDRSDAKHREVEKSIKNRFLDSAFGCARNDAYNVFNGAFDALNVVIYGDGRPKCKGIA